MSLSHNNRKPTSPQARIIGYARVSTDHQATEAQEDELQAAGCTVIYCEQASGASKPWPEIERLMAQIQPGDVLTAVRLYRLALSVSHLLETVETNQNRGAYCK